MVQINTNADLSDTNTARVFVIHADSILIAQDYAATLKNHGIPCRIENCGDGIIDFSCGLFVPQDYSDEAHMILETCHIQNGFYDFFFDDTPLEED